MLAQGGTPNFKTSHSLASQKNGPRPQTVCVRSRGVAAESDHTVGEKNKTTILEYLLLGF